MRLIIEFFIIASIVAYGMASSLFAKPSSAIVVADTSQNTDIPISGTANISISSLADDSFFENFPPHLLDKLDQAQLFKLMKLQAISHVDQSNNSGAIVVPIAFFLLIFFVVAASYYSRYRRDMELHKTLRAMVEKGSQIPNDLLTPPGKTVRPLHRGVIWVAFGIGFTLFFAVMAIFDREAIRGIGIGLIPLFLGAGYLVIWKIEKN